MHKFSRLAIASAACVLSASALAAEPFDGNIVSGTSNGISWRAQSLLTGFQLGPGNGTGTATNPGNATYLPSYPAYSGVVGMFMNLNPATPTSGFVCTGTLLPDRMSILTAAHCVSDGFGTANPAKTTVFFQPPAGIAPQNSIYTGTPGTVGNPQATAITVSQYFVNPGYTGEVIDQNDIAVLRLSQMAPDWAISHGIYTNSDLTGQQFNVAGYGRLGSGSGTYTPPNGASTTGRLRQGDNQYDYSWGDARFGGFFTDRDASGENFFGKAEVAFSFVSDFDNGLAANNMAALVAAAVGAPTVPSSTGLGNREVGVAGGDSGGPNFINGLISGVNSYGLTFGASFGDVDGDLNSSFGEFSGYVPTFIHAQFIQSSMVPEPATYGLMALGLLAVGAVSRRRRS